ncbi:MAG: porin [Proteobacteria bacterium]|nr:porin [Pseudomonadota bacterium]
MQKKLIALAVAGLLSAPAFAQSNVTLYGTIDYGFVSLGSSTRYHQTGYQGQVPVSEKYKTRNAIDSGVSKANRIGFRGTEDLGNGLKAVFVLEEGLNGDNDAMLKGNNRQSYAGLAGAFGTVAFGRQYTPQHLFTSAVDPFGKNGLGATNNVLVQDARLNNLAAYISPSFGGFSFIVGYTFNGAPVGALSNTGQEAIENKGDVRVWAIAPSFTWNNLFVGANYHTASLKDPHKHIDPVSNGIFNAYDLFASYDFGFVKVGSTIGRRTTKRNGVGGGNWDKDSKVTQWMIGATFKITPNDAILTSYSRASENKLYKNQDGKPTLGQWAIGYEHALSKRTVLYSQFAVQNHNKAYKGEDDWGHAGFYGFGGVGGGNKVGSVDNAYGSGAEDAKYRRGFTVGFRHDF